MTQKKVFTLDGLHCASCAIKIETQIKQIPAVISASLNFGTSTLSIETANDQTGEIVNNIHRIVKALEPHVVVIEQKSKNKTIPNKSYQMEKPELFRLSLGTLLFITALFWGADTTAQLFLYLASYLLVGGEVLLRALKNIYRGQIFDENFLMAVATIGAIAIGEFSEAIAVMLFYQVGEAFQDMAVNRSRHSIQALLNIRPDYANLKTADTVTQVEPEDVKVGDIIIVKPGERVPLDGKILEGTSFVDTSALTGESVPRKVHGGEEVLSGFINTSGVLTVEVLKEYNNSAVARILDLVQNASNKKAKIESFITKFARYYTPVVVFTALGLALLPPLITGDSFSIWLYRALIFLVISCPCALVISIPLSFFGGIGGASKNGILIKGGNYLEALNSANTVVFDKTGTLTKGVFTVSSLEPTQDFTKEELLKYAVYAEYYSNHPIARSIREAFQGEIDKEQIQSYQELAGLGIKAVVKGKEVLAGSPRLIKPSQGANQNNSTETVVHISIDGIYAGKVLISDELKEDSIRTINELRSLGIEKIHMLSGDSQAIAETVGAQLSLDQVYGGLLPHEKVERMEQIYNNKRKGNLIYVGDGINDAPVLARADIGVAMGALGSDAAIEAADVVLMTDEPSKLVTALTIAKKTRRIVWQNIILALGIKGIVLVLGAGGMATMWEAVFADVGVALLAILNSMRILKK